MTKTKLELLNSIPIQESYPIETKYGHVAYVNLDQLTLDTLAKVVPNVDEYVKDYTWQQRVDIVPAAYEYANANLFKDRTFFSFSLEKAIDLLKKSDKEYNYMRAEAIQLFRILQDMKESGYTLPAHAWDALDRAQKTIMNQNKSF